MGLKLTGSGKGRAVATKGTATATRALHIEIRSHLKTIVAGDSFQLHIEALSDVAQQHKDTASQ